MIAHSREGRAFVRAVLQHVRLANYHIDNIADARTLRDRCFNGDMPFPAWGGFYHKQAIASLEWKMRRVDYAHYH